jgi:DNA-binding transcriptional ArsR family regulator
MSDDELDPVIHAPARLRIVVTLATLREGDNLSFTRLQELIGLTPGNLITHLRKLEDAGYVTTPEERQWRHRAHLGRAHPQRAGRTGAVHHGAAATARLGPVTLTRTSWPRAHAGCRGRSNRPDRQVGGADRSVPVDQSIRSAGRINEPQARYVSRGTGYVEP